VAAAFLSKSRYLMGTRCPKQLWMHCNDPEVLPAPDAAARALLAQGREVARWSRELFPRRFDLAGTVVLDEALAATTRAVATSTPVFEAALRHERCVIRADILEPAGDGCWNLIEVKSSTEKKPVHLADLAFQRHVCEGAGLRIRGCFLLLIDTNYVRNGPVEAESLFTRIDVTVEVAGLLPAVASKVKELLAVIDLPECPDIRIGPHCSDPYPCPLTEFCWRFLPHPSIFDLRGGGSAAWRLFEQGVLRIEDITADFQLNGAQAIQVASHRSGVPHTDIPKVRAFLDSLKYPLHFLDLETIQPAVPLFDRSSPYGQIPFQFSLHIVPSEGAAPVHHSFLAADRNDPRQPLLAALRQAVGETGSIVAYNTAFEIGRLRECSAFFPTWRSWVERIVPRFVDLFGPFRSAHYYHPAQNGSASLKAVLPALTGRGYDGLEIHDGGSASREFLRVTFGGVPEEERARVLRALEAYCEQDTRGMIDIVNALKRICA
jgi:hypothetical protein